MEHQASAEKERHGAREPEVPLEFLRHTPTDVVALAAQIEATRSALERALPQGDAKQILDHAGALTAMLAAARREREGVAVGCQYVALARSHPTLEESPWLLHGLATASQYAGERSQANALFSEALESARRGGWRRLEHFVLHHWGRSRVEEGDLDAAEQCFLASRAIRLGSDPALVGSSDRALAELAKLRAPGGGAEPRFHTHVFFEPGNAPDAERLRADLMQALGQLATVGEYFDRAAGPLPKPSFEIAYARSEAARVESVIGSMCHGRPVLVHPVMEDEVAAHTTFARWLGEPLPLRMEASSDLGRHHTEGQHRDPT